MFYVLQDSLQLEYIHIIWGQANNIFTIAQYSHPDLVTSLSSDDTKRP